MRAKLLHNGIEKQCTLNTLYPQQAADCDPPHTGSGPPHDGSFSPRSAALIIAAAQPTPLSTFNAPVGQLSWHAPHSMQVSARTICTRRVPRAPGTNTPCGHTALHIPQLIQASTLNSNVLCWLSATNPVCASLVQSHVTVSILLVIVHLIAFLLFCVSRRPSANSTPAPNIPAITRMYRNISRFTPVLDVNGVEPVKLSARKAVTGGRPNI